MGMQQYPQAGYILNVETLFEHIDGLADIVSNENYDTYDVEEYLLENWPTG